jgi:hypothetical protein
MPYTLIMEIVQTDGKLNMNNYPYHVLDPTTPWYEWLCYQEICYQLNISGQPSWNRFMRYRNYLREVGVL